MCGEGGEYESLCLDCPPLFTHARIVLDSWRAVLVSEDSMAPVALLHPTAFHAEPKQQQQGQQPAACDEAAAAAVVVEVPADWAAVPPAPAGPDASAALEASLAVQLSVTDGGQYCSLTASVAPAAGAACAADLCSAEGTAAALSAALRSLTGALRPLGLRWQASLFVHLYVPSMAQFGAANAAYAAVLPAINPPSRATVQLSGGGGDELALVVEVLFTR